MKKIISISIVVIILTLIASNFCSLKLDDYFMTAIFSITGIMFSVGIGLIVTFNFSQIRKKKIILDLRKNLKKVRDSYIIFFGLSTLCYILDYYIRKTDLYYIVLHLGESLSLKVNLSIFFLISMLCSIFYFILNFISIQKLNEDLFDRINKELDNTTN